MLHNKNDYFGKRDEKMNLKFAHKLLSIPSSIGLVQKSLKKNISSTIMSTKIKPQWSPFKQNNLQAKTNITLIV
jgi:hypothetical protein